MPLLDLLDRQRAGKEIGRIRLGQKVEFTKRNGDKGTRPAKLATFRFTTNSEHAADQIAATLGGTARPWQGGTQKYEVVTESDSLDIMVPPGEAVISQWWELWSGGGCTRRCDGVTATLRGVEKVRGEDVAYERTGQPCVCPPGQERAELAAKGNACKPTTRLNVILPDLPDVGVWRVESHGFNAAVELGGDAALLGRARDAGVILPATLRLEFRSKSVPGKPRQEWYVPRLELRSTLREILGASGGSLRDALPPAPVVSLPAGAAASAALPATAPVEWQAPANPQDAADRARATTSLDEVAALWAFIDSKGALDAPVTGDDDAIEPLRDLLTARMDDIEKASR